MSLIYGAIQTLEVFQAVIAIQGQHDSAFRRKVYRQLLDAIVTHRVGVRPGRFEPCRIKRRHGKYDLLTKPRQKAKREKLKRLKKNYVPFVRHSAEVFDCVKTASVKSTSVSLRFAITNIRS